jgi:hypothetical protein
VREIRAQGDRIVDAIHEATARAEASREALGNLLLERDADFLRAALDEAAPRTIEVEPGAVSMAPPVANDAGPESPSR